MNSPFDRSNRSGRMRTKRGAGWGDEMSKRTLSDSMWSLKLLGDDFGDFRGEFIDFLG
jgi:hypothetical protein